MNLGAYARPDRQWLLGIIPWFRPSTAFGYAQVLDSTWDDYLAKSGHVGSRNDFDSATTFIGWYAQQAQKRAKVPKNDAYKLYLAYHEGIGGYSKKTYLGKPWLISVAKKVKRQANRYSGQLRRCANRIPQRHWWSFW